MEAFKTKYPCVKSNGSIRAHLNLVMQICLPAFRGSSERGLSLHSPRGPFQMLLCQAMGEAPGSFPNTSDSSQRITHFSLNKTPPRQCVESANPFMRLAVIFHFQLSELRKTSAPVAVGGEGLVRSTAHLQLPTWPRMATWPAQPWSSGSTPRQLTAEIQRFKYTLTRAGYSRTRVVTKKSI